MRETAFIKQNRNRWLEFEKYLFYNHPVDADFLSELFVQLNNDLSYAQTYYPKSNVIKYLNALASNAYHKINQHQKRGFEIKRFFAITVPEIAYRYRWYLRITILLFLVFLSMGILSAIFDDSFIRKVLGDEYIDMTMENIRNGDPAAVYNNSNWMGNTGSFLAITINNFRVGLLMYISGFTLGIGTLKLLFSNTMMVGGFQTLFYNAGKLAESMSAIWIHGSMEIFGMNIEAAAGFILGLNWLFPGSKSRYQSFLSGGKDSLILMISTIPFTISAGFLEGFITQLYNEMPLPLTLFIIFGSLSFISWYYLIYPNVLNKKLNKKPDNSFLNVF